MYLPPNKRYRKIAIACVIFMIFGILNTWVIFPPVLRAILKSQVVLKNGTQMRDMYNELPFPLYFKVYLFNVLNPDEVMKGAKPKLQEVGPYVFEEWKTKINQVEDLKDDTIEFTAVNHFIYNQMLSNGLTGDEQITVIHPLLTSLGLAINRDRAPMLGMVSEAIKAIFHKPTTAFWTGKVMDLLYNGFDVDCTSEDYNAKTVCSIFDAGEVKEMSPKEGVEDMYKFALFKSANGTAAGRYKTYRGKKDIKDVGKIIEYEGEPQIDIWDGDVCNEIRGTDSSIFPPFGKKEDGIWLYERSICRSVNLKYEKDTKYRGIPTLRFLADFSDIVDDESMHCFCPNDKCTPKGTLDLYPCTGIPIIASMPHFCNGDQALLDKVESGMEPDREMHLNFIDFEIISGTPMSAAKRIQINMDLKPIPQIDAMKNLPEMLFPVFWCEEGADLDKTFVNMLKYQLFLGLKVRAVIKWLALIVGPIGAGVALFLDHKKRRAHEVHIENIAPAPITSTIENDVAPKASSSEANKNSNDKERY